MPQKWTTLKEMFALKVLKELKVEGQVCVCVCVCKIDDILVGFYTNRRDPVNRVKKCQCKRKMACGHPCRSKALEKVRGHWIQGRSGRIGLRTNSVQGRWQRRL